jgi:hypothetical protein
MSSTILSASAVHLAMYPVILRSCRVRYDYDIWYNGTLGDCSKLMKVSVVKRVVTHVSGDSLIK